MQIIIYGIFLIILSFPPVSKGAAEPVAVPSPLPSPTDIFQFTPLLEPLFPKEVDHPQYNKIYNAYMNLHRLFGTRFPYCYQCGYIIHSYQIMRYMQALVAGQEEAGPTPHGPIMNLLQQIHGKLKRFINQSENADFGGNSDAIRNALKDELTRMFFIPMSVTRDRHKVAQFEYLAEDVRSQAFIGVRAFAPLAAAGGTPYVGIPDGPEGREELYRNTLKALTGRIFVVKRQAVGGKIVGFSSGMLIPEEAAGGEKLATQLITTGHSFKILNQKKQGPDLEYYFVRTEALNLNTGLPPTEDIKILGVSYPGYAESNLVAYLTRASRDPINNNVRRIIRFNVSSGTEESELENHIPNYSLNKDCGTATLNQPFVFVGADFANFNLQNRGNIMNFIHGPHAPHLAAYRYYAIGYPAFMRLRGGYGKHRVYPYYFDTGPK